MPSYPIGSPVLVVGNVCRHRISVYVGLYGYVSAHHDGALCVSLFRSHDAEPSETSRDWPRFNVTTAFRVKPADLRPLTGKARLARVARLIAHEKAEAAKEKPDSVVDSIMANLCKPEAIAKREADYAALEAEHKRLGRVFTLSGTIKRGNKSAFPRFRDDATRAIVAERDEYAYRKSGVLTVTERARWQQANEAIDSTSFWSGRDECRDLVRELDLDPMASSHEGALWRNEGTVYCVNGSLRAAAFRLWNKGAQFLYIQDMRGPDECWGTGDKGEPAGFLISYAYRRKLPICT